MTPEELELSNEYQRRLRKKEATTPEMKRAWSLRVSEYAKAKPKPRKPFVSSHAVRSRQRRANNVRRLVMDAIKLNAGCADCGNKSLPACCYDFDHIDSRGKSFSIGVNIRRQWSLILDEIQKCEVVCANCHRVRTNQRLPERLPNEAPREFIDHRGRTTDLVGQAKERGLL